MNCPKCQGANYCKDGIVKGRQRYLCKQCKYRYTVEKKSDGKSAGIKRLALEMYPEDLGFRSIGRVLQINYGTVCKWIKEWGSRVSLLQSDESLAVVKLDEMHSYVGSKKLLLDLDCC